MADTSESAGVFSVDRTTHLLGGLVERFPRALKGLGRLETRALEDRMGQVTGPVYVAGLARAGSTLLLELLSWHKDVVTHRYRDFPMLHVPFMWNRFLELAGTQAGAIEERAHRDGILVNRESPEAFEEVLWMSFFPDLHDTGRSCVLGADTRNAEFERFYQDHIRKLLLLRDGTRYVSKGNYNVTRLEYLLELFPDARFVVPVREPASHVASLMRQHELFLQGQRDDPRARAHLRRVGHFEFGEDRRVIHTGDDAGVRQVLESWEAGEEAEGWARYWNLIYDHISERLSANRALAEATLLLPFETLRRDPEATFRTVLSHCGLDPDSVLLERIRTHVRAPRFDGTDLEPGQRDAVERVTRNTLVRLNSHLHVIGAGTTERGARAEPRH